MTGRNDSDHWLVRPGTIRALRIVLAAVLSLTVVADFLVARHSVFGPDGTFGFSAWFGFASCVVLVAGSLGLGKLLKRRDDYYER